MNFILTLCFCILAFSESLESTNKKLMKTNKALLKTLRELAVGEDPYTDQESQVGWRMSCVSDGKCPDKYYICISGRCSMPTVATDTDAAESAEMAVGQDEGQAADDGGCYTTCREAGKDMNQCARDCPMPGETVVEHDDTTEEEVGRTNPWPCRDTNKVEHGRSMKPGQMCNTDWTHVTYWNARHEYCKNDKGNWGCEYGYKRVGWWNDYCCSKWESRNTNKCRCR